MEADNGVLQNDLAGTRLALAEAERHKKHMRELYTVVFKEEVDIDDEEAWKGKLKRYVEDQELLIQNARVLPGG